jgi:hypothetical protein
MRANRHRQFAALLRPDAPADTIRGLKHERVVCTQFARGCQTGDASTNDDHVAFFGYSHALILVANGCREYSSRRTRRADRGTVRSMHGQRIAKALYH